MGLRQAVGGTFVGAGNGFAAPVDGMLLGTMLVTIEGVVAGRINESTVCHQEGPSDQY